MVFLAAPTVGRGIRSLKTGLITYNLREVVRAYQSACTDVITRYDGHVAQLLGDGLLVYYGYPVAHEDDAQRAIYAGLGIVEAIGTLNDRLEQDKGIRLAVRLGIHTGLVVIGEMGSERRQEQLALGETPNVTARIQGLAEPDTVVISADTHRLIQGYFDCDALGEQMLRGVAEPITVYQVLRESGVQSRLEIASSRGLTPMVGREQEVGLLLERWEQCREGHGQVILLSGEAGIGKSRLVQALKDHVADEPHSRLECRSSPYYANTALYPMTDLLQRTLHWRADETAEQCLEKLEQELSQYQLALSETVPLFASLLSLAIPEDRYPPLNLSPQRQREKTLEAILAIVLELADPQPVLFVLEDLHWTDPTSLELIDLLIDQTPTASLCVLLTCRPEFQPSWSHRSYLTEMTLNRLSRPQVVRLAEQVADSKSLPAEVLEQLVDKTDGVPLYVEEMTKAVLESGVMKEVDGQYELTGAISSLSTPATLQDSLMSRLDRLMTGKVIAQLGATIGRQFSYVLLHAVSQLDETVLQHELGRLVEAELVYQRGLPPQAMYTFKHALVQDAAYQSLLRSTRQGYHRRIAEGLEEQLPETAEMQPELLAYHYTEAGLHEQAVGYWQQAGEKAIQRSANAEAIAHLTQGLALIETLPDTSERALRELTLQRMLGVPLLATKGFTAPEVERAYARARTLCEQVQDSQQVFPVLFGLWGFYHTAGNLPTAQELAEQILTRAQHQNDPALILEGHRALGDVLFWRGVFTPALSHLEQGIALYDAQQHRSHAFIYGQDPGMGCRAYAAMTLWVLGYPDQALHQSQESLTLAQALLHPFSLLYAINMMSFLHAFHREGQILQENAETQLTLSTKQGSAYGAALGRIWQGLALTMQGQGEKGCMLMDQGLTARQESGAVPRLLHLGWLAGAYGKERRVEEGLNVLAKALEMVQAHEERCCEAELHRLKGELLLQQSSDNAADAESCFHQAIAIAQNQSAKSWELRAATNLARLWQSQGKRDEARELLAPVYDWFTEGFDTADLIDAKALLDELE